MLASNNVLIVTPQKSGSHLISNLFTKLNYKIIGEVHVEPEHFPNPKDDSLAFVNSKDGDSIYLDALDWNHIARVLLNRLGAPTRKRYGLWKESDILEMYRKTNLDRFKYSSLPSNICCVTHQIDLDRADGALVSEVLTDPAVKVILNIRDPRDILLSYVDFLGDSNGRDIGPFYEYKVYRDILAPLKSVSKSLEYIAQDKGFPFYHDMWKALALQANPDVLVVRYEDLVGQNGGGSIERQHGVVNRLLNHLELDREPGGIANALYDRNSFTFNIGSVERWKSLTESELQLLHEICGPYMEKLGYEVPSSRST